MYLSFNKEVVESTIDLKVSMLMPILKDLPDNDIIGWFNNISLEVFKKFPTDGDIYELWQDGGRNYTPTHKRMNEIRTREGMKAISDVVLKPIA